MTFHCIHNKTRGGHIKVARKKTGRNVAQGKIKTVKKSFIKRIRNYFIFSIAMMFIGGAGERYKTEIFQFVKNKYNEFSSYTDSDNSSNLKNKDLFDSKRNASNLKKGTQKVVSNKRPSEIIRHKYYTLSYNEDWEQPNWVSYRLTKNMVMKKVAGRTNDFRPDPLVSTGSSDLDDYRRSGYDRGHLCPAAAMAFSKTAMSETFYMSNMSPQVPGFNRGIWKKLEEKVRGWAVKNIEISVVTGPIFYNNRKRKEIGNDKVDVPDAFYKVILDNREPDIKAIGFIMPNKSTYKSPYNYAVPVDTVEAVTGIDFFSYLPDKVENKIERDNNYKKWLL